MNNPHFHLRLISSLFFGLIALLLWTPLHAQTLNGITQPYANASLVGSVNVMGTADHPTFRKWQLDLLIDGDPKQATFVAVSEEPLPTRTNLTTLDTRPYPDGAHALRLRVVHSNLNYDEYVIPVRINNVGSAPRGRAVADAQPDNQPAEAETPKEVRTPTPAPKANNLLFTPPTEGRWIEVDISDQTLTAWDGEHVFMETLISSGRPETPTVAGVFSVQRKVDSQRMVGPGYNLPNVTSVMYFFSNYAIHAAYWHDDFGQVMSHGCVNMRVDEAEALYHWAELGTPVYVHD